MSKILVSIRNFLLDLLFPLECLNCRHEGAYLCENCLLEIKFNDKNYQDKLKINLKVSSLDGIAIAGDYADPLLFLLITKFKYHFIEALGLILAHFLIKFWEINKLHFPAETKPENHLPFTPDYLIPFIPDYVIAIPLSKKRKRWRGFNQAEIMAREFSGHFDYEINLNLKRVRHQTPQANLTESERLINIKSAFAWSGKNLNDKNILLIDDVVTTGATLNEAARVLKEAGAKSVSALVLAKG
jgi:ComF family protein